MAVTVNLIGPGRVGRTLLRLFHDAPDIQIGGVMGRSPSAAQTAITEIGAGQAIDCLANMPPAAFWFLTVPDSQIAAVAEGLSQHIEKNKENKVQPIAVHCSGYHTAAAMAPLEKAGFALASAHPMLSFADPETAANRFAGTLCGVEGAPDAVGPVQDMLASLGAQTFPISSDAKALYHAAAVITNNFTTVLQATALELWDRAGVPPEVAKTLNTTLLRSTVENIQKFGPEQALTGPAARGDRAVVDDQHQHLAEWDQDAAILYDVLSRMATRLKDTGRSTCGQDDPPRQ